MGEYARQPRSRATQFDREEDYGRSRGIVQSETEVPGRNRGDYYDNSPGDFLNAHLSGCSQSRAPPPRSTSALPEPWMYEDDRGIGKKVKHKVFGGRERANIEAYHRAAMLDSLGQPSNPRPVSPRHYDREVQQEQPQRRPKASRKPREEYSSDSDSDEQQERAPRRRTSSQKAAAAQAQQQPQPIKSPRRAKKSESESDSDDQQERAPRRRTSSQKAAKQPQQQQQPVKSPRRSKVSDSGSDSDDQQEVAPRRKRRTSDKGSVSFAPATNDTRKVPVLPVRKTTARQSSQQKVRSPRESQQQLHLEPVSPRSLVYQTDRSLAPGETRVSYGPVKHPFQGMPHTDSDVSFYNLEYRVYYDNEEVKRERCLQARATFNYLGILIEDDRSGDFIEALAVREVESTREDPDCGAWIIDVSKRSHKSKDLIEFTIVLFSNEVPQMQRAWRRISRAGY